MGQAGAVKLLSKMIQDRAVPHALLLTGPSGTGKTTAARALAAEMGCDLEFDFNEINCGIVDALKTVRMIRDHAYQLPIGKVRVWILDEAQALSRARFSQQALLKILEDPPDHAYYMLCTTDPQKIIPTVRNRCTEIKLQAIRVKDLTTLCTDVVKKEKGTVPGAVLDKVVELANGSARRALVLLEQVLGVADEDEALELLQKADATAGVIDLAKLLMNPRCRWPEVAVVLRALQDEDHDAVRRATLGYARAVLLGGKQLAPRAYAVIQCFRDSIDDCGHAGLAAACWELLSTKK